MTIIVLKIYSNKEALHEYNKLRQSLVKLIWPYMYWVKSITRKCKGHPITIQLCFWDVYHDFISLSFNNENACISCVMGCEGKESIYWYSAFRVFHFWEEVIYRFIQIFFGSYRGKFLKSHIHSTENFAPFQRVIIWRNTNLHLYLHVGCFHINTTNHALYFLLKIYL